MPLRFGRHFGPGLADEVLELKDASQRERTVAVLSDQRRRGNKRALTDRQKVPQKDQICLGALCLKGSLLDRIVETFTQDCPSELVPPTVQP